MTELRNRSGRVLVLDDIQASASEIPEPIQALIDEADDLYIVAPTLTTRLQSLATDVDGARVLADERLRAVFDLVCAGGLEPHGRVGDENHLVAIADALAAFDADRIVLTLHPSGNENWREHRLAERVRSHFDLPTTVFVVGSQGQVLKQEEA